MSSDRKKTNKDHQFRLPALETAATEFQVQLNRSTQGPFGCLFIIGGITLIVTFMLSFDGGSFAVVSGLIFLVISIILMRLAPIVYRPGRMGMFFARFAVMGLGAAISGGMLLLGVEHAYVYWILGGILCVLGLIYSSNTSTGRRQFLRARISANVFGCKIGFFRPFHTKYSYQAKNILFPLLRGYGSVFFVADESFDHSEFDGPWSQDYQELPGLVGAHRYTDDEWKNRVMEAIRNIDVAVIDISVPRRSLVWEIKQCYDQLPSHRIIFVVSVDALPSDFSFDFEDDASQAVLWAHFEPILIGLKELGANPTTQPICLIYTTEVVGQVWLANALYQAMFNIVVTETGN